MEKFCQEKEFAAWFETSAKDNLNIDDACRFLVSKVLENDLAMMQRQAVAGPSRQDKQRSGIVRPGRDDDRSQNASGNSSSSCCN